MSNVIKAIVGVAVAAVGVITGNPLLIAQGASMTLGAVLTKSNAGNKATSLRLSKRLEPEDFRKIVFGKTMAGNDMRYWEVWGSTFTNYDEVIAVATHTINSFQETYIEDELVNFSGGVALGTYAGALSLVQTTAVTPTVLSVGAGAKWTANSKFTGVPHFAFKWAYTEKKLPRGIPSRYTRVVEGALVYDPRKDSTRGGSGSHRANDQTTWQYSPTDTNGVPIGRNNALQMLWYLIGWRINSKVVAGRAVEFEDIDFASFITAANDCETRQYYTDMILSTGDSHSTNEAIISADGLIGEVLDLGGLWTYQITKNDLADIAVALTEDDVVESSSPVQWVPFKPMSDKYNEVAGTYVDASSTGLYQPRAYPLVFDAAYYTADNYKKRKLQNFQGIQDAALAQKLARILLNRARYQGEFSATFNLRALRAKTYSVITLSISRYGFVNKLFRVIRQSISAEGVEMVLREEDASIYTGGTVTSQAAPSAGTNYNPAMEVAVTGLAATAYTGTGTDGTIQDGMSLSWTAAPGNVSRTEVQVKLVTDTSWQTHGPFKIDVNSIVVFPLLPGTIYNVRVRHISVNEVQGLWANLAGNFTAGTNSNVSYTAIDQRARTYRQATSPTDATEGDYWTDTDDGNLTMRHGGLGLFINGVELTINGNRLDIPWVTVQDQGIINTVNSIAAAVSRVAQAEAAIVAISSDNILSKGEKAETVRQVDAINAEYAGLVTQANSFGVTTELTAYTTAYNQLIPYVTGLPSWNDANFDTPIVGTTFRGNFNAYYSARTTLLTRLDAVASTMAQWSGVGGTGKPADNATVGAPSGTSVGGRAADDIAGTIKPGGGVATNKVDTAAIISGSVSGFTAVSAGGSSVDLNSIHELAYVTIPSGGFIGSSIAAYGQLRYIGGGTAGYPVLRLYRVLAANAASYISSGSGSGRNPASFGSSVGKNTVLLNFSNIDLGGTLIHNVSAPVAGDLYVLAADITVVPPGTPRTFNYGGEVALINLKT